MRAEIDQDNSMAKSPPRTIFLRTEPANTTGILFRRKESEELCPVGTELSKTGWACPAQCILWNRMFPATRQSVRGAMNHGSPDENGIRLQSEFG